MPAEIEAQLCQMSPSTIDRLLRPWRQFGGYRGFTTTKPGSLLKNSIPIRTFADWEEDYPGFLEIDLVHYCGESTEGFYLTTLSTVDVATGW
ncbi:MAG: transposase, partial [Dehalococcoidia bacterium]|nr:transposase [Dehalococcoidia bacterium]